ncbi:MAG: helix-turn-helix domain-containing protein [Candidatus Peribacteraceae bacterium]|nr:helix-turn-helix domain-containing protein [Candidatus Peribacteraceae bacterium]
MRSRIQDLLRLAGLREEEIALYLQLLKLRRASMTELIAASGLNVMTAYRTMKRLQDRGLVSPMKLNRKQSVFSPLTLRAIITKLDADQRKMRKLRLALAGLDSLLPYLDNEAKIDEAEPVEIREGVEAFREEYLKLPDCCTDEYLHLGNMANYWRVAGLSDEAPEELAFRRKRLDRGIYCRIFNPRTPEAETFAKRDSRELRTSRLVDDIPVTDDYLAFADAHVSHFICDDTNPRVIVIRQPELIELYRNQFESMWKQGVGA